MTDHHSREMAQEAWRPLGNLHSTERKARVAQLVDAYAPFVTDHGYKRGSARNRSGHANRKGRRVVAGGREFPSVKAAADALGVHKASIYHRAYRGVSGYRFVDPARNYQTHGWG